MLPVTAVMIDWSSAVVKPKGRYLELAVRLSTAPDSVWKNEFARISHMTDGLESEPWWANVPDFACPPSAASRWEPRRSSGSAWTR